MAIFSVVYYCALCRQEIDPIPVVATRSGYYHQECWDRLCGYVPVTRRWWRR